VNEPKGLSLGVPRGIVPPKGGGASPAPAVSTTSGPTPDKDLQDWLTKNQAAKLVFDRSAIPYSKHTRGFFLTSVRLSTLTFPSDEFNPRTQTTARTNEIRASITSLGLLTPLTCAYIPADNGDPSRVVLIDGRHRFKALKQLEGQDPDWGGRARVDLKIYVGLERSDLYLLAAYLNRTRKNLTKGEYYKVVVEIFDEKKAEIEGREGSPAGEERVFGAIAQKALQSRDFDLSVGRVVGMVAFTQDYGDDSWFPMVGSRQQEAYDGPLKLSGYKPITAGNLAAFLRHLCWAGPYPTEQESYRATELTNVGKLGELFRDRLIKAPVRNYDEATETTMGCKHWTLVSLGIIFRESRLFAPRRQKGLSALSEEKVKWPIIRRALDAYADEMADQARRYNEARASGENIEYGKIWAYQTQSDLIIPRLRPAIVARAPEMEEDPTP
jgi:ParB-like nuclease domain